MTVEELIQHLQTLPPKAIVGYADPCFGGLDLEADKSDIFYDEQKNATPCQPYVKIGVNGECHLD